MTKNYNPLNYPSSTSYTATDPLDPFELFVKLDQPEQETHDNVMELDFILDIIENIAREHNQGDEGEEEASNLELASRKVKEISQEYDELCELKNSIDEFNQILESMQKFKDLLKEYSESSLAETEKNIEDSLARLNEAQFVLSMAQLEHDAKRADSMRNHPAGKKREAEEREKSMRNHPAGKGRDISTGTLSLGALVYDKISNQVLMLDSIFDGSRCILGLYTRKMNLAVKFEYMQDPYSDLEKFNFSDKFFERYIVIRESDQSDSGFNRYDSILPENDEWYYIEDSMNCVLYRDASTGGWVAWGDSHSTEEVMLPYRILATNKIQ